jgi:hypothetical protein
MTGNNQPLFAAHAPRGLWRFNLQTHPSTSQVASSKRLSNAELYRHVPTAEIVKLYEQGLSQRKIGRLLGMGPRSVGHRLRQVGKHHENPRVTPEELKECRRDPAWEARNGVVNRVICRVCGEFKSEINANGEHSHLRKHHMTVEAYKRKYPGARLVNFARSGAQNARQGGTKTVQQLMDEFAVSYLTPNELTKYRRDHEWEENHDIGDFVACRLCGFKFKSDLYLHLRRHGYTPALYRALYPKAPLLPLNILRDRRQAARARDARGRAKLAKAERLFAGGPGRRKKTLEETMTFTIGKKVESMIPRARLALELKGKLPLRMRRRLEVMEAALATSGFSEQEVQLIFVSKPGPILEETILARHFVANETGMDFATVGRHHRWFVKGAFSTASPKN